MFPNGFFGNVLSRYSEEDADSILNGSNSILAEIKTGEFFLCIIAALILGILIGLIYILTHKKEGYSQSYVMTMIMLPTIVTLILLVINSTAGAISVAGAFSLVRFRSVAGDPKDISYIFFAMAVGVACGIGYVGFAVVFFILLAAVMFALTAINFGENSRRHMTLKITIPEKPRLSGSFRAHSQ